MLSFISKTQKISMSSSFTIGASPEAKFLVFKQRNGESLKMAWDRISKMHKRLMPWIHIQVIFRSFYYGIFEWCRHSLDMIAGMNFLECNEARTLDIINGLANLIVNDPIVECVLML